MLRLYTPFPVSCVPWSITTTKNVGGVVSMSRQIAVCVAVLLVGVPLLAEEEEFEPVDLPPQLAGLVAGLPEEKIDEFLQERGLKIINSSKGE